MEWLTKLLDVHRLPFKVGVWVMLVSGTLVFGEPSLLGRLGLASFASAQAPYVGTAFLASTCLVAVNALAWCTSQAGQLVVRWRRRGALPRLLRDLDHAERAALREFFILGEHTIEMPVTDPAIVGLLNKGIVECGSTMGRSSLAGPLLPCSITPAARAHLTNVMLDLPTGEPSEEDLERIRRSRPAFAREVQRRRDLMRWW